MHLGRLCGLSGKVPSGKINRRSRSSTTVTKINEDNRSCEPNEACWCRPLFYGCRYVSGFGRPGMRAYKGRSEVAKTTRRNTATGVGEPASSKVARVYCYVKARKRPSLRLRSFCVFRDGTRRRLTRLRNRANRTRLDRRGDS